MAGLRVVIDVEVRGKSIEDLSGVREVRFKGIHGGVGEGCEVEVQERVTARLEVGDDMAASFARAASEHNTLSRCGGGHSRTERTECTKAQAATIEASRIEPGKMTSSTWLLARS